MRRFTVFLYSGLNVYVRDQRVNIEIEQTT
jgi:hypothetical protein